MSVARALSIASAIVFLGVGFLFGGTVAAMWLAYYNYMCYNNYYY